SLVIKTLSKPIANQIKAQAREHARFRRLCISFAQSIHRIDMRLRLGLLQDTAAIDRQAAKEAAEAQAKKHKIDAPTVKTEAQTKLDEAAVAREKRDPSLKAKTAVKPRIRPLSEAKAIDTGANFISETFLFLVGGGLIVFESFRSRRKESNRREDVAGRIGELEESERNARRALVALEKEVLDLRAREMKHAPKSGTRILPKEVWEQEEQEEQEDEERAQGWWSWVTRRGHAFPAPTPAVASEPTSTPPPPLSSTPQPSRPAS
ncbi:MAG: hypothetical protein M1838_005885, partial [Thelocarpon superellum]